MAWLLHYRRGQCSLDRPSTIVESLSDRPRVNTCLLTPFSNRFGFAIQCQKAIAASIATLLFWSRPAAIVGFIALIVIYAVYRSIRKWDWPHISQKVLKTVYPTIAHPDAASAPVGKRWGVNVIASLLHSQPSAIFRRPSLPMFPLSHGRQLCTQAATTRGMAAGEIACLNDHVTRSAVAVADPKRSRLAVGACFTNRFTRSKATVPNSSQVDKPSHTLGL